MTSGKWNLRSDGYMKPGCDYQEIAHMKANRAIEHGDRLVFTKKDGDGNVLDERVYLRPRHGGTQWKKLFGTPYTTAVYFAMQCFGSDGGMCYYCPFDDCDEKLRNMGSYPSVRDTILEWLESEVRDD